MVKSVNMRGSSALRWELMSDPAILAKTKGIIGQILWRAVKDYTIIAYRHGSSANRLHGISSLMRHRNGPALPTMPMESIAREDSLPMVPFPEMIVTALAHPPVVGAGGKTTYGT